MCHRGAADLGVGTEKSRRDLGGAEKKSRWCLWGAEKNLFFSFDELDDKNCFEIAL